MNTKIGALVKTSLVDFPGMVSTVIFFKHCNLRCPYCYNVSLVNGIDEDDFVSLDDLKNHLRKRKNVISGLVISGGEALLSPYTKEVILFARELGYKIKLDTNGTLPEKLEELLKSPELKPDFIAMDIKTSPSKYGQLLNASKPEDKTDYAQKIKHSVSLLKEFMNGHYEFRTVLVPTLIKSSDITEIGSLIPKESCWRLAEFKNENCLEPLYNSLPPHTEKEELELEKLAKSIIPDAKIR